MAELKIEGLTNQQYNSLRNKFNIEIEELESIAKKIEKILELKERIRELKDEISFGLDSLDEDIYESLLYDDIQSKIYNKEIKISKREDNIINELNCSDSITDANNSTKN